MCHGPGLQKSHHEVRFFSDASKQIWIWMWMNLSRSDWLDFWLRTQPLYVSIVVCRIIFYSGWTSVWVSQRRELATHQLNRTHMSYTWLNASTLTLCLLMFQSTSHCWRLSSIHRLFHTFLRVYLSKNWVWLKALPDASFIPIPNHIPDPNLILNLLPDWYRLLITVGDVSGDFNQIARNPFQPGLTSLIGLTHAQESGTIPVHSGTMVPETGTKNLLQI